MTSATTEIGTGTASANQINIKGQLYDLASALDSETDILQEHREWVGFSRYVAHLRLQWSLQALSGLAAYHLGVQPATVTFARPQMAQPGSFNVAFTLNVDDRDNKDLAIDKVVVRCPIPPKCGEEQNPGAVLEKMQCEVAAYVYMQRFCPDVRIPKLYGFGFPNGMHINWRMSGYMVLEHFGASVGDHLLHVVDRQLAEQEKEREKKDETAERPYINPKSPKAQNLYRSLARLWLSLGRIPQPRIGSYTFHFDGTIALDHRPLSWCLAYMESRGAPRVMAPETTYASVEEYVSDMLEHHQQGFLAAPNAAKTEHDCRTQMAVQTFFRTLASRFLQPTRDAQKHGLFSLWLSDTNVANLFADKDWNITGMIDLEWVVSVPADMHLPPPWLHWIYGDVEAMSFSPEDRSHYDEALREFLRIMREEEAAGLDRRGKGKTSNIKVSDAMCDSWTTSRYWFYVPFFWPGHMHNVAWDVLLPQYGGCRGVLKELWKYWSPDVADIVEKMVQDRQAYVEAVTALVTGISKGSF